MLMVLIPLPRRLLPWRQLDDQNAGTSRGAVRRRMSRKIRARGERRPDRGQARTPAARQLSGQQCSVLRRLPHQPRARQQPDRARADGRVPGRRQRLRRQGDRLCMGPNITPEPETGIGSWKDDEILRALRDGVSRDGHFMTPLMPFDAYQHLSDEDARAVVAYLRTVPPYRQARPRQANKLGFMQKMLFNTIGVQMHKPIVGVAQPDRANQLEYGHYLMRIAACRDCHSLADRGPRPETDPLAFAGSEVPFEDPGLGKVYAANISGDTETGLGRYSADAIKQALRNGTRLDGKRMAPPMSLLIPHISGMSEPDIDALVAYMKTLPPARRKPPERELVASMRAQLGG